MTGYIQELFELSLRAQQLVFVEERYALALELYERIMCNIKVEDERQENLIEVMVKINVGSSISDKEASEKMEGATDTSVICTTITRNLSLQEDTIVKLINPDTNVSFQPTSLFFEIPMKNQAKAVVMDKRFSVLSQLSRQKAVVNRPYGRNTKRGNNIRQLYRIGTDQKIFAEPAERPGLKPGQVALLLDCSGSMRMNRIDDGTLTRMEAGKQALLGAAVALSEAQWSVGVYGHLADTMGENCLVIFRAKGFNESIEGLSLRLEDFSKQRSSGNRDGYAIEYVASKMKETKRRRVLIIISDGLPAGQGGYEGNSGIEHIQKVVKKCRAEGIDILSITIAAECMSDNNRIYGASNNVYNNDPRAIEFIVAKLIGAR
jgi:hypothetical protein